VTKIRLIALYMYLDLGRWGPSPRPTADCLPIQAVLAILFTCEVNCQGGWVVKTTSDDSSTNRGDHWWTVYGRICWTRVCPVQNSTQCTIRLCFIAVVCMCPWARTLCSNLSLKFSFAILTSITLLDLSPFFLSIAVTALLVAVITSHVKHTTTTTTALSFLTVLRL